MAWSNWCEVPTPARRVQPAGRGSLFNAERMGEAFPHRPEPVDTHLDRPARETNLIGLEPLSWPAPVHDGRGHIRLDVRWE
jgi:hypothetical protein